MKTVKTGTIAAICLTLAAVAGCASQEDGAAEVAETQQLIEEAMGTVEVQYHATGSAEAVTYTAEMPTGTSQGEASLPLKNQTGDWGLRTEFNYGDFVYFSVQNQDAYGEVTCEIRVNGIVISKNTSTADYGIATCKGSAAESGGDF